MTDAHHGDEPRSAPTPADEGVRLQKVLASAGIASRRGSEVLIDQGRVEVNGRVVVEQGLRVDPDRDVIRVDGSRVPPPRRHRYLALHKPRGVVSTMDDPEGRRDLGDFVPGRDRLFHVGRLDTETEGLLLLTNDGEFAHRLAHPSWEVRKTYLAEVRGVPTPRTLQQLRDGIVLDDGPVHPDKVTVTASAAERASIRITLHEGRNHIVRRMLDAVGHPVRRLSRISVGPVRLGNLPVGQTRDLTDDELGQLHDIVGL